MDSSSFFTDWMGDYNSCCSACVENGERREKVETQNLNQDALENTFGAIRLHCGSNNRPSVGQFVDALNGLAYRGLLDPNVMMMVPLFWTICIPFSIHPVFLHPVSQQVMTGRPPMMFHTMLM